MKLFFALWILVYGFDSTSETDSLEVLSAIVGGNVDIPCNITAPWNDSVLVILWYKDTIGTPIYRVDSRKIKGKNPGHYIHGILRNRGQLHSDGFLEIKNLTTTDSGVYRCRVDFNFYRSVDTKVKLQVYSLPDTPVIRKENGEVTKNNDVIGPLKERDRLVLFCSVKRVAHNPLPSLKWFRSSGISIGMTQKLIKHLKDEIQMQLVITNLKRQDHNSNLSCVASLQNLTETRSTVKLSLYLKPRSVKISLSSAYLISYEEVNITCIVNGSKPPPVITWWKRNTKLQTLVISNNQLMNGSAISVMRLVPTSEDNGMFLTCTAYNPHYPRESLQDRIQLSVMYRPELILSIENQDKYTKVVENSQVNLHCSVKGNPKPNSTEWFFNGIRLDNSSHIFVNNSFLVINSVKRRNEGMFICSAFNSRGRGNSNSLHLRVLYAPICNMPVEPSYGVSSGEAAVIDCSVLARPENVIFYWAINTSSGYHSILTFRSQGLHSTATYIPNNAKGYGDIKCWATNKAGEQLEACTFNIYNAEPPQKPSNCTANYSKLEYIRVKCVAGNDGGMRQTFHMEMYDEALHQLIANISAFDSPNFLYHEKKMKSAYMIIIYSANAKGRSHSVAFLSHTSGNGTTETKGHVVGRNTHNIIIIIVTPVLIGSTTLIFVSIIVSMIMKKRSIRARKARCDVVQMKPNEETDVVDVEESNPDVVPTTPIKTERKLKCFCCCLRTEKNQRYHVAKADNRYISNRLNGIQTIMDSEEYYLSGSKSMLERRFELSSGFDDRDDGVKTEEQTVISPASPMIRRKCESAV